MVDISTRRKLAIAVFLLVVLSTQNFKALATPFWKAQQVNPLLVAYKCAESFKPAIRNSERIGFFYESPQPGFPIYDKRIAPQIQLQYVLIPQILDHRPEKLGQYDWVIGYFVNEKMAKHQAIEIGPILGMGVEQVCANYVLFKRSG